MDKNEIEELIKIGLSINKLSEYFNVPSSTLRYWLKKYGLKTYGKNGKIDWSKENILKALENAECKSDIIRNIGSNIKASGNFQTLDKYCQIYNIDLKSLQLKNRKGGNGCKKLELENIFIENSTTPRATIKNILIRNNLLPYKCEICNNNGTWLDKILSLHLDHINGINNDNRKWNLRFLCPNCHSQTETYCGKKHLKVRKEFFCKCGNKMHKTSKTCKECAPNQKRLDNKYRKVKERPSIESLLNDVYNFGYEGTGRKYGVVGNTIRKWLGENEIKLNNSKRKNKPKCLNCEKEIGFGTKRCSLCNKKYRNNKYQLPEDIELIIEELKSYKMKWCCKKYIVNGWVIKRWIKEYNERKNGVGVCTKD